MNSCILRSSGTVPSNMFHMRAFVFQRNPFLIPREGIHVAFDDVFRHPEAAQRCLAIPPYGLTTRRAGTHPTADGTESGSGRNV